jgi:hypothetical protein
MKLAQAALNRSGVRLDAFVSVDELWIRIGQQRLFRCQMKEDGTTS